MDDRWDLLARDAASATAIVERAIGRPTQPARRWTVEADTIPFDNLTTAGLARVRGDAVDGTPWSLFVKTVRHPSASPVWALIPPPMRASVEAELPWRGEIDLARSPIAAALPPGLRMPVLHGIEELDGEHAALWMEDVPDGGAWDLARYGRAARALGRLAGALPEDGIPSTPAVRRRDLGTYVSGFLAHRVIPRLRDDATWSHPVVAASADDRLRDDLLALAQALPQLLEGLDDLPRTLAHGDACPQNLLEPAGPDGEVVAIDWPFVGIYSVGYDLGQLLAGRADRGDLHPADLLAVASAMVPAYVDGARDVGAELDADAVELGFRNALVVRSALTAIPVDRLGEAPSPALRDLVARRVAYARFLVDLVAPVSRA